METLLQDIRYGFRMLWKAPGFTAVAIITLALGIGVNSALFSVVNGVLLNPLPYTNPDQLVALYARTGIFQQASISYLNFLDWQKDSHSFSAMALMRGDDFNLIRAGESERLHGHMISAGFFALLGLSPSLGREFRADEDAVGAAPVALISDGLWKRRFGSDPDILGKTLILDGNSYTVLGVVPGQTPLMSASDVYVPIGQWADPTFRDRRVGMGSYGYARLKLGTTIEQARADLAAVAHNLAAAYPASNTNSGVAVLPAKEDLVGNVQQFLLVLFGGVGFVLLIACANVANLLLARSTARTREFAIRAAVGASRSRVVRQLLTESVLLSLMGAAIGLGIANWGTDAAIAALPSALPRSGEIHLDARVLVFTLGIALLSGIIFGLVPALKTLRPNLYTTLKEGGRGGSSRHHRTQNTFVAFETALALVLLVGAGLMIRTLAKLWTDDTGFDPQGVLTFTAALSPGKTTTAPLMRASYRELENRYATLPGVESVSFLAGSLPMRGDSELPFWREGQPKPASDSDMSWALFYMVTPDYWKAMHIPLLRGRLLTPEDNENSTPAAVVDESFAKRFFPNEDPIGKRINLGIVETQSQIVGIVGHVNHWGLGATPRDNLNAQLYLPVYQMPDNLAPLLFAHGLSVVVRTHGAPESFSAGLRNATTAFDSQALMYDFVTMNRIVSDSIASQRFSMWLLGSFAGLALLLSAVGIYGVISYFVGQRTQEMGIRMALGAQRKDVLMLILGQGARMALIGVAVGLAAALGLTRLMASMLYGVRATDPLTYAGVGLMLSGIAIFACYIPALRATRVDPMVALRYE